MSQETTEGIVLRAFDYKERMRILTLFSKDAGLISLIVKGISQKNSHFLSLSSAFSNGEFIFKRGKSDLYSFLDGTLLDAHPQLRTSLTSLKAASALTQAVLSSQLPDKPAPALYFLLKTYLKQIPFFLDPRALIASFYLKLLRHEGLLSLDQDSSDELSLFSLEEWNSVQRLMQVQHFSALQTFPLSMELEKKIETLFKLSGTK